MTITAMYTNAEMEYRMADSTMISIAIRGWRVVPGIRDTIKIRMTIITVDSTVVTMDNENELSSTMLCGSRVTLRPNIVIPRAGN